MIKSDKKGLVNIAALNNIEIKIFIKFLLMERKRHEEDIENIDETVARLRQK